MIEHQFDYDDIHAKRASIKSIIDRLVASSLEDEVLAKDEEIDGTIGQRMYEELPDKPESNQGNEETPVFSNLLEDSRDNVQEITIDHIVEAICDIPRSDAPKINGKLHHTQKRVTRGQKRKRDEMQQLLVNRKIIDCDSNETKKPKRRKNKRYALQTTHNKKNDWKRKDIVVTCDIEKLQQSRTRNKIELSD